MPAMTVVKLGINDMKKRSVKVFVKQRIFFAPFRDTLAAVAVLSQASTTVYLRRSGPSSNTTLSGPLLGSPRMDGATSHAEFG